MPRLLLTTCSCGVPTNVALPDFHSPAKKFFPFHQTGLEKFGPFASKSSSTYYERYALKLNSLTTRAVQLELCVDLSSDATMNALQHLFSRRGYPAHLVSDRGTKFIATEKELQINIESTQVLNFLTNLEIKCSGSSFRRSVGTIDSILQGCVLLHLWMASPDRRDLYNTTFRSRKFLELPFLDYCFHRCS